MVGWIILGVFGFIILLLVLLFTVHAYINIDLKDELALTVRVLGIPIKILPKKPKKYNIKKYTLKKIRKRDAKAAKKALKKRAAAKKKAAEKAKKKAEKKAELAKLTKAEKKALKKAKKAKRPKMTELIPLVTRIVGLFFSRFFGKIHIKVARFNIRVGGGDAMAVAMTYGVVYQSVGYLMKLLEKICHVDGLKKAEISVVPDYTLAGIVFDCDLTFRVSLGNLVGALLKAGFAFLKGYIKIKPDPDHPETAVPVPDIPHAPKIPLPVIPSPPSPPKAIGSEKPPDAPLPPVM
ncbi:MAG: DUF2953 domain-containing protein [Clostridia bacterium]|nr:DUF2953 domain-containing protein [Clostridia bacterium]